MKWTLVTGGAKRLGATICYTLAKKGYPIVVHYNKSKQEAEQVATQCQEYGTQAAIIQGDFSSTATTADFISRYMRQFNETEHLINNVGNYLIKSALETTIEEWNSLFQTNLHAPFALMGALSPSIARYRGSIINIGTSGVRHVHANLSSTAYSLTKLSLWMLTCSLAKALAPQGIRVNMVSPGVLRISVDLDVHLNKVPMQRPGECEEVSRVVAFLLDPINHYITGQNIEVAGGLGL